MAVKATIFKATLDVVDMDRHYYAEHRLILARHPSETDERMMVRILAFALCAHERLEFGKGISDSGEPDLWRKGLSGDIELWIELGHPDAKVVAKACKRSRRVIVYAFSARPETWWDGVKEDLTRFGNLEVVRVDARSSKSLAALASPTMGLQCSVQEGEVWFRDDRGAAVRVEMGFLHGPAG